MSSHQGSPITVLAGEALEAFRLVKFNGTAWVYADAADRAEAVTNNYIANGESGSVSLLSRDGTLVMTAGGAISAGDQLFTAADGKVAATGTNHVGRAKEAAADGSTLEAFPKSAAGGGGGVFVATYMSDGTPAATDRVFFVAPFPCKVLAVSEIHATAAGGTSELQLTKDSGTDPAGDGDDLLSSPFNLNGTAATVQNGTLVTTAGYTTLAAGDRLAVDYGHAIQSTAGVCVSVMLQAL